MFSTNHLKKLEIQSQITLQQTQIMDRLQAKRADMRVRLVLQLAVEKCGLLLEQ